MACLIPARLGSTRLRRKNLLPLDGVPLLAHTIACGLSCFDEVFVCTESEAIAEVATQHGATITGLLPEELCGDLVASWRPCVAVVEQLVAQGRSIDDLVCLQPTSPLRTPAELTAAGELFRSTGADFVVSVTQIDPHFFHWALEQGTEGWRLAFGDRYLVERPLLPPRFRPNGSIKIARVDALVETGSFFGPSLQCVETAEATSVHVATATDLLLCEALLRARQAV